MVKFKAFKSNTGIYTEAACTVIHTPNITSFYAALSDKFRWRISRVFYAFIE